MAEVAVMGFAPHSGWAAVVVLGGPSADPRVLSWSRVEMADERAPDKAQVMYILTPGKR